jgi:hypothetical protein
MAFSGDFTLGTSQSIFRPAARRVDPPVHAKVLNAATVG